MARHLAQMQPASAPAETLGADLARIRAMNIDQLRTAWPEAFASDPPLAFSKDLLARAVAFHAQQKALGGLPPAAARLLRSLIKPGVEPPRQVKVGSVIVRKHQGVVHEVLGVRGGFYWPGKIYDNLSTIAKKITGTSWNGPRFFGLRSKRDHQTSDNPEPDGAPSRQMDEEPFKGCRTSGKRPGVLNRSTYNRLIEERDGRSGRWLSTMEEGSRLRIVGRVLPPE
jgi:hypothetical protein